MKITCSLLLFRPCVSTCPEGSYADLKSGLCGPCVEPCYTCIGGEPTDCLACQQGLYYLDEINRCVRDFPDGYYEGRKLRIFHIIEIWLKNVCKLRVTHHQIY